MHEANFQYLLSCREAALYAAKKFDWQVLNCCDGEKPLPIETIAEKIWEKAAAFLEESGELTE